VVTELAIDGRLETPVWSFEGRMVLSETAFRITTEVDLPPILGVDPGPSSCELEHQFKAQRLCGSCRSPACDVSVCFELVTGEVVGDVSGCAGPELPPLPDGSPCVSDDMCQSKHCTLICYTPGIGGPGSSCDPAIADQCAADLQCSTFPCDFRRPWTCIPPSCQPRVGNGDQCASDEQCPAGMTCRPRGVFLSRECLWPRGSREVGEACVNADECATWACVDNRCRCVLDTDCAGAEVCALGECVAAPDPPRLPGQSCSSDAQCLLGRCVDGVCGCQSHGDCDAADWCASASVVPTPVLQALGIGTRGVCVRDLEDGLPCDSGEMCKKDACGATLGPKRCYGANSAGRGAQCYANEQCQRDMQCQLDCNWSGLCIPLTSGVMQSPPADCTCTTTCQCTRDDHCGQGQYCAGLTWGGAPVPGLTRCFDKGASGTPCQRDDECRDGTCGVGGCVGIFCAGAKVCQ